jgi:hypothetical protein
MLLASTTAAIQRRFLDIMNAPCGSEVSERHISACL